MSLSDRKKSTHSVMSSLGRRTSAPLVMPLSEINSAFVTLRQLGAHCVLSVSEKSGHLVSNFSDSEENQALMYTAQQRQILY